MRGAPVAFTPERGLCAPMTSMVPTTRPTTTGSFVTIVAFLLSVGRRDERL